MCNIKADGSSGAIARSVAIGSKDRQVALVSSRGLPIHMREVIKVITWVEPRVNGSMSVGSPA